MTRYRPFLMLGAALLFALFAARMAYRWTQSQSAGTAAQVQEVPRQEVAVAAADIPRGTTITAEMVRTARIPSDLLPAGTVAAADAPSLVGRVAVVDVLLNEPLLQAKLASLDASRGVAALLDPGKRAMAVRVDDEVGVAGFVKATDHVDVFVTLVTEGAGNQASGPVTKLILADTPVLAIGSELVRSGRDEVAIPVQVITLEVTPAEAEKLAYAATLGKFRLALRSPLTKEVALTPGATADSLLGSYQGREVAKPGTKAPPSAAVQLIRGKEVSRVQF